MAAGRSPAPPVLHNAHCQCLPDRLLRACLTGCCRTTLATGASGSGSGSGLGLPSRSRPRLGAPLAGPGELAAASRPAFPVCTRPDAVPGLAALLEPDVPFARALVPDRLPSRVPVPVRAPVDVAFAAPPVLPAVVLAALPAAVLAALPVFAAPPPFAALVAALPVVVFAPDATVFAAPEEERERGAPISTPGASAATLEGRGRGALVPAAGPAAVNGSQFLNMKYCWPSVHMFVVTQ